MEKRIADWLEKISAGSALIGLYQNNPFAMAMAFLLRFPGNLEQTSQLGIR